VSSAPTGCERSSPTAHAGPPRDLLKSIRVAAAVAWSVIILALCWIPRHYVAEIEDQSSWFDIPNLDKIVHCGIFVVFALLWLRVAPSRRTAFFVLLGGFVLGAISELGQLVPIVNRDAEIGDLVTDSIGLLIGLAIASVVEPLFRWLERLVFRAPTVELPPGEPAAIEQ
jgi:glycopeptide antibiotics resistance protein